ARRPAASGQQRHLRVSQVLDVRQQERLALFGPQALERPVDLLTPRCATGGMILCGGMERYFIRNEGPLTAPSPCAQRATPIHQTAKQPGTEPDRVVPPDQRTIRP